MRRWLLAGAISLMVISPTFGDGGHTIGYQGATAPTWSQVPAYRDTDGNTQQVTPSTPLPVLTTDANTLDDATDYSGSITTADEAQTIIAANTSRHGWIFQNVSDATIWVNVFGDATEGAGSIKVTAGALFIPPFVNGNAVSVISDTAGSEFTAAEW